MLYVDDSYRKLLPRAAIWALVVFFAARVANALWVSTSDVVLLLVASLFFSFALEPFVSFLEKRRVRRGLATGFALFATVLFILLLLLAAGAVLVSQADSLTTALPGVIREIASSVSNLTGSNIDAEAFLAPGGRLDTALTSIQGHVLEIGSRSLAGLGQILMLLFFTFYLSADAPRILSGVCSLFKPERQGEVRRVFETAVEKTGGYLASRAILAVASTLAHALIFALIGVPYAIPLALWVGVVSQAIPVIGTYLAAALPVAVSLGEMGATRALVIVVAVTLYQQIENSVLSPRIVKSTVSLHPVAGLLAVIVGSRLAGVAGALFAIPLAATVAATLDAYVTRHNTVTEEENSTS